MLPNLRRRHAARTRTRGQSLVEFALVLPLFLVFVAACLDLGRVFYANISLNNAAREGAMAAAQQPTSFVANGACDPVTNMVTCRVQLESKDSMIEVADSDVGVACSVAGCPELPGSFVTVEVRGSFRLITPLLSFVFGGQTLNLTSSATAQIEYLPDPNSPTLPPGPVAEFSWSPSSPVAGEVVTFDPSASTGEPEGWNWDFDEDGVVDSTDEVPTWTFPATGDYDVSLTVINLAGVNTRVKTVSVGGTTPTEEPTTAPTPTTCPNPPNVIGLIPGTAQANLINAGYSVVSAGDLTNGPKNKVQAQNPDHTQSVCAGATITIHWRPA